MAKDAALQAGGIVIVACLVVARWKPFFLGVHKSFVARSMHTPSHIATTAYLNFVSCLVLEWDGLGAGGGLVCCVLM